MTDITHPGQRPQFPRAVDPTSVAQAAIRRALEPAPNPRPEQQKVGDLGQLAGWLDAICFLDLLELAKSITESDADPAMPADVKLAKALATWARATIKATA